MLIFYQRRYNLFDQILLHFDMEKNHNGRWTEAEHEMFLQGLQIYGKNWKKIQQMIKTRSGCQIRSHAQKFFLKHKEKLGAEDQQYQSKHENENHKDMVGEQDLSAEDYSLNNFDKDTQISFLQIHLHRFSKQKSRNGQLQNQLLNFWNNYIDIPIKSSIRKNSTDSSTSESPQNLNTQNMLKNHSFIPFEGGSDLRLKHKIQNFRSLN